MYIIITFIINCIYELVYISNNYFYDSRGIAYVIDGIAVVVFRLCLTLHNAIMILHCLYNEEINKEVSNCIYSLADCVMYFKLCACEQSNNVVYEEEQVQ